MQEAPDAGRVRVSWRLEGLRGLCFMVFNLFCKYQRNVKKKKYTSEMFNYPLPWGQGLTYILSELSLPVFIPVDADRKSVV